MLEVLILALALSMDACAVAISVGAKYKRNIKIMLLLSIYFGLFQAIMPGIGFVISAGLLNCLGNLGPWLGFVLLIFFGLKMIYESFSDEQDSELSDITHKALLLLALATSIDAMAAGFSLSLLTLSPFLACLLIGLTTFFCSIFGYLIGQKSGAYFGKKAELFGGVILIGIAFKIVLF